MRFDDSMKISRAGAEAPRFSMQACINTENSHSNSMQINMI